MEVLEYYSCEQGTVHCGDSLVILKDLPCESAQCIITSPPYFQQREYKTEGQLGLEPDYHDFISNLCDIFDEAKRVLKDNGTIFVNMGDSYAGSFGMGSQVDSSAARGMVTIKKYSRSSVAGIRNKSLIQIPARFAIEMVSRQWILRNEIIWEKGNTMPSSAKDRFTCNFEKVFFFSKNPKYKFNQQLEPYTSPMHRWGGDTLKADNKSLWDEGTGQCTYRKREMRPNSNRRIKRCVWNVDTVAGKVKHFAVYPPRLIEPCILAGTDKGDVILDPFLGSGTTALEAVKHGRRFAGIEISEEYCKINTKRIKAGTAQRQLFN